MNILRKENGKIGNLTVINRLVRLEPTGEALVIGDLHGDLESLTSILETSKFIEEMTKNKDAALIFLGDYGDRGQKSPETYFLILKLKIAFPSQVILLRGNHEAPQDLLGYPHNLPTNFQQRFNEEWHMTYEKIRSLHSCFYNAVYVEHRYLMLHGGISPNIKDLNDIAQADDNQDEELLEELLWNDPDEYIRRVAFSPRGAGKIFGKKVTESVLENLSAKILIRGHEPINMGYKMNHDCKVLTLFSRKGSPYFNQWGAYLQLPLAKEFEDASQLLPFIHKF